MGLSVLQIRSQILSSLESVSNPQILMEVLDFVKKIKAFDNYPSNKESVMSFAGVISDTEAEEMINIVQEEFNDIEGEW